MYICICIFTYLQMYMYISTIHTKIQVYIPIVGYVWRPPGVGQRADGLVDVGG